MAGFPVPAGDDSFRNLIEAISDIVLIADLDGRIVYANPAATRVLGYGPGRLVEMEILDLHPEWCRQEAQVILGEMVQGDRQVCPLPLRALDGRIIPVETRVWFGEWGGERRIFGMCKDLSTEQELLQKFEKVFQVNPAPMAISDVPGRRFLEINRAFEDVLGYAPADVLGRTVAELDLTPDQADHDRASAMLREHGVLRNLPMRVRAKDGTMLRGLFSGEMIESQGRTYFLTVMIDDTARKKAEQEREQVIVELESALAQIRELQEILPICCNCKKIRDGRGYWEQVEAYLSRRTGARFSHGICPECRAELYPELGPGPGAAD